MLYGSIETSGSLREVAFTLLPSMCALILCIVTLPEPDTHTRESMGRCFRKAAPVVVACSYRRLCSLSTRGHGSHKAQALAETLCWRSQEVTARDFMCTVGDTLFAF